MAGVLDELFQVDTGITEGLERLRSRGFQSSRQRVRILHDPHSLATAPGGRLHHHRKADLGSGRPCGRRIAYRCTVPRNDRHPGVLHPPASLGLVAHGSNGRRRRADEGEASLLHRLRERGSLRQESVSGVDRIGARFTGRRDQALDGEIALGRARGADGYRLVRRAHVGAPPVNGGVDGNGFQPFLVACANDAESDLAAVGDEDALHRTGRMGKTGTRGRERTRRQRKSALVLPDFPVTSGRQPAACLRRPGGSCCRAAHCSVRRYRTPRGPRRPRPIPPGGWR